MADVMEQTEELSSLDKELIFAYTSYQNACHYCFESHKAIAQSYGLEPRQFEQLVEDLDSSDLSARLKSVLRFVEKLSHNPSRVVAADIEGLAREGYSEEAIMDIISVCALAHYMNRFVDGQGVDITSEGVKQVGPAVAQENAYAAVLKHLEELT